MSSGPNDERMTRAQQARQVLAGSEVRAPQHPLDFSPNSGVINPVQRTYLIVLGVLLVIAAILYFVWGLGVASPVLFVLALALFLGWVIF